MKFYMSIKECLKAAIVLKSEERERERQKKGKAKAKNYHDGLL